MLIPLILERTAQVKRQPILPILRQGDNRAYERVRFRKFDWSSNLGAFLFPMVHVPYSISLDLVKSPAWKKLIRKGSMCLRTQHDALREISLVAERRVGALL
jgi:hypothetical protein